MKIDKTIIKETNPDIYKIAYSSNAIAINDKMPIAIRKIAMGLPTSGMSTSEMDTGLIKNKFIVKMGRKVPKIMKMEPMNPVICLRSTQ